MKIRYTDEAKEDISYWKKQNDAKILDRISRLIYSIEAIPHQGIGRPELLKYNLSGLWSWRINKEHRIVYQILDDYVLILSLRGHYK